MPRRKADPDKDWITLPATAPSEYNLQVRFHGNLVLLRSTVNRDDQLVISVAEYDALRTWFRPPDEPSYEEQLAMAGHVGKLVDEFLADPSIGEVRSRPKK